MINELHNGEIRITLRTSHLVGDVQNYQLHGRRIQQDRNHILTYTYPHEGNEKQADLDMDENASIESKFRNGLQVETSVF